MDKDIDSLLDPKKNKNPAIRLGIFKAYKEKKLFNEVLIDRLIDASMHNLVSGTLSEFNTYYSELSIYISEKQLLSTERLNKSSKNLERYSVALVIFTIVLIAMTAVLIIIPSEFPWWDRVIIVFFAIIMARIMLLRNKKV